MGKESEATVYVAELQGIEIALKTAGEVERREVAIFTDDQATLKSICNPGWISVTVPMRACQDDD